MARSRGARDREEREKGESAAEAATQATAKPADSAQKKGSGGSQFALVAYLGGVIASVISFETTWSGFREFYGGDKAEGVVAFVGPLAISLIVQVGIFFASVYLSDVFVRKQSAKRKAVGASKRVGRSLTMLVLAVLILIAPFSIFFSYGTLYDRLLDDQLKEETRVESARNRGSRFLSRVGEGVDERREGLAKKVTDSPEFVAWSKAISEFTTQLRDRERDVSAFFETRKDARARALADARDKKTETEKRLVLIKSQFDEKQSEIASLDASVKEMEKKLSAPIPVDPRREEVAKLKAEMELERSGVDGRTAGEGPKFRALAKKVSDIEAAIKRDEQGLSDEKKRLIALKQKRIDLKAESDKLKSEAEALGEKLSDKPTAETGPIVAAELYGTPQEVSTASIDLERRIGSLRARYAVRDYDNAVRLCRNLTQTLAKAEAFADARRAVACELPSNVKVAIAAFIDFEKKAAALRADCATPPIPDKISPVGSENDAFVRSIFDQAGKCAREAKELKSAILAVDTTVNGKMDAILTDIVDARRATGSGVVYLQRMGDYLVSGDVSAWMAMGLATMIDGLVLVLAFFAALQRISSDEEAVAEPLSPQERRELAQLMQRVEQSHEPMIKRHRDLLSCLHWDPSFEAYRIQTPDLADPLEQRGVMQLVSPLLEPPIGWQEAGRFGRQGYAYLTNRGLYDLLKAAREDNLLREGSHPQRYVAPPPPPDPSLHAAARAPLAPPPAPAP
ncbi:MAG: hypothetical protein MRY74_15095, partial [Neomegalonema sp.]|nr:hypothetical protein [Neomegalonema sp.]